MFFLLHEYSMLDTTASCPYDSIVGDFTCISTVAAKSLIDHSNVKEQVTATANQHLSAYEKLKLMRTGTTNVATGSKIPGDALIGELIASNTILLPIPLDPHSRWGPIFENFLFHNPPMEGLEFPTNRSNAARIYDMATNFPCPLGIVPTACVHWKTEKTRKFYGHLYTPPRPNSSHSNN